MEGLECKKWGEISVTATIFVRREVAVADGVYIRNGSRTNIGAQTYTSYQYQRKTTLTKITP
jgi:tetrahydrodipicolinate N-succinyltransferase